MTIEPSAKNETNTTDATSGQSLRARVAARKAELEAAIADPATDKRTRGDLQSAASQVEGLLTGDLDRIPNVVAVSLNAWLEANKHLDERHAAASHRWRRIRALRRRPSESGLRSSAVDCVDERIRSPPARPSDPDAMLRGYRCVRVANRPARFLLIVPV